MGQMSFKLPSSQYQSRRGLSHSHNKQYAPKDSIYAVSEICMQIDRQAGRLITIFHAPTEDKVTTNPSFVDRSMCKASFDRCFVENHRIFHVVTLHSKPTAAVSIRPTITNTTSSLTRLLIQFVLPPPVLETKI